MDNFLGFIRRIFGKFLLDRSVPIQPDDVAVEDTHSKSLKELGRASLYWDNLYSTYSDGINMLDDVTVDMVTRSLQHRLRLDGLTVIDCEIEKYGNEIYIEVYVVENNRVVKYCDQK